MKILLTGSSGFIGGELKPLLIRDGHEVYELERYVAGRIGRTLPYEKNTYFADLRDNFAITKALEDVDPEIVIHLAALTAVAYSYAHPQEALETNLIGTVNLAELCTRFTNLKQFIFASTAEVYGTRGKLVGRETDKNLFPSSPYAISKLASEKYLQYLHSAFGFPVTIFRFFNTYGRKRDEWFVVERIITQMLNSDKCYLGDPEPVRDFIHVDDHLKAYLHALGNKRAIGEIFNVASGKGISIRELADKIASLTNFKGEIVWHSLPERSLRDLYLVGSNKKIRKVLKVPEPKSLEDGLKETIDWWKHVKV
jgi:nucleoside-diphosphate-sugar epimerase